MQRFKGKVGIVTGAASGLGRAIALRILEEGGEILGVDRKAETDAALERPGLAMLACDVAADDAPSRILAAAIDRFGALDLLVNNAGRGDGKAAHETTDDAWDKVFAVNLRAAFRLSRDALRHLRTPGAAILNIASSTAISGYRSQASYTATKAGMLGLTRQMAVDYAARGVRVNAIAPGVVATGMTAGRLEDRAWMASVAGVSPMNRAGTPEEVAGAAAFLLSDDASFVTGHTLAVDGGASSSSVIAPEIMDAWVALGEA